MRSHAVVIVRIVFQNPTQMFLVQDNDVVQTLAPDRSDQPFGKAVLPRRGRCNWLFSDTHGTQSAGDDSAVDSISISDHIARSAIPRKSLGDLTCNPLRRWVGCDADPDEISAIKPDDDEAIQQLKANGRHDEQIHGGDVRRVVSQKGPPFLTWRPASLDQILGDICWSYAKHELEQFAVDARRTPKQILRALVGDKRARIVLDRPSPSRSTRFPTPIA